MEITLLEELTETMSNVKRTRECSAKQYMWRIFSTGSFQAHHQRTREKLKKVQAVATNEVIAEMCVFSPCHAQDDTA